jgi:hypothetical protein
VFTTLCSCKMANRSYSVASELIASKFNNLLLENYRCAIFLRYRSKNKLKLMTCVRRE